MKKLVFLAIVSLILSCAREEHKKFAIISGMIHNTNSDKLTLYNEYDTEDRKIIPLSEEATFQDTIYLDWNHRYFIVEGKNRYRLFLSEGDDISIQYDSKKMDSTLVISGIGSQVSNYLLKKETLVEDKDFEALFKENEIDFKQHLSDLKTQKLELLTRTSELSDPFIVSETNNIQYEYLKDISRYELYHGYYTNNREFKVSENFEDELLELSFDQEQEFQFSFAYRDLVSSHYTDKMSKNKDTITPIDIQVLKQYSTIDKEFIKNELLYQQAKYGITYTEDLETYYQIFSAASTNKAYNEKIDQVYNALTLLTKGNPSPKFTDYENYAGGTTSLDDLKGDYIYIDVWATWCGPCKAEIPFLKKVEQQYHGRNIEFVSISIDDKKDHGKWKKMVADKELAGTQLFADNNWESKFIQDYMIKGIPRFILIDPSGAIVDSNAPRPSNGQLIKLFDELEI